MRILWVSKKRSFNGRKDNGYFWTCKMFNKNILAQSLLYGYIIDNQSNIFVV